MHARAEHLLCTTMRQHAAAPDSEACADHAVLDVRARLHVLVGEYEPCHIGIGIGREFRELSDLQRLERCLNVSASALLTTSAPLAAYSYRDTVITLLATIRMLATIQGKRERACFTMTSAETSLRIACTVDASTKARANKSCDTTSPTANSSMVTPLSAQTEARMREGTKPRSLRLRAHKRWYVPCAVLDMSIPSAAALRPSSLLARPGLNCLGIFS